MGGTLIRLDDYIRKPKVLSEQAIAEKIGYVAVVRPAALFSLAGFCSKPETGIPEEYVDLLIDNELLYRDLSVPFMVRMTLQKLLEPPF